jgi:hypothetical protein
MWYVTLSRATTRDNLYTTHCELTPADLKQVHEAAFAADAAAAQAACP